MFYKYFNYSIIYCVLVNFFSSLDFVNLDLFLSIPGLILAPRRVTISASSFLCQRDAGVRGRS